jgi:hypothetical protein
VTLRPGRSSGLAWLGLALCGCGSILGLDDFVAETGGQGASGGEAATGGAAAGTGGTTSGQGGGGAGGGHGGNTNTITPSGGGTSTSSSGTGGVGNGSTGTAAPCAPGVFAFDPEAIKPGVKFEVSYCHGTWLPLVKMEVTGSGPPQVEPVTFGDAGGVWWWSYPVSGHGAGTLTFTFWAGCPYLGHPDCDQIASTTKESSTAN